MRSVEERAVAVEARIRELDRRHERRRTVGLSALSTLLLAALVFAIGRLSGGGRVLRSENMTGSSLLSEGAGGYVLVAVLSFAAAVAITVLCFRFQAKQKEMKGEQPPRQSKEETI